MKREFLQLAQKFDPKKYSIGGWWWSEKLDGERCFWDGGITTGLPKLAVPWANVTREDRYIKEQIASGLWSRYGHVIHAPAWWLEQLPRMPLDGELYSHVDGMNRQDIHSAIKKIVPIDSDWKKIVLEVFDSPPYERVFADGLIDNINYSKVFKGILPWVEDKWIRQLRVGYRPKPASAFKSVYQRLYQIFQDYGFGFNSCMLHPQYQLPYPQHLAVEKIKVELLKIEEVGGEGIVVRNPDWPYMTERTKMMLKVKSWDDAEGTVIGYITGRETDKGSKLMGMMGALVLKLDNGETMELSGFTEEERKLHEIPDEYKTGIDRPTAKDWAIMNPEAKLPSCYEAVQFPRGLRVSFKYRGLNNSGIPNEARFWRKDERI